jgi:hypothetical protein
MMLDPLSRRLRFRLVVATAAAVLALVGCGTGPDTPAPPDESTTPPDIPSQLTAFPVGVVDVQDRPWLVAYADTRDLRMQGLMGVTDLGALDGMLFVFQEDTTATFHMRDTLIPLDVAFFDAIGGFVSVTQMVPCTTEECPSYPAAAPYRYAIEAPAGDLIDLPPDAVLDVGSG